MDSSQELAIQFQALADENRLKILQMLISGEKCACMLLEELHITQPTLSHHMRLLTESGLVVSRKAGKWRHYSINLATAEKLTGILSELANSESGESSSCAPQCQ
ncbi:MAG TPA: metalloregulator ArsR/SmtB family transcription factor [Bellilinea sp.]|nr:metalloregulator ArsR/SmtB family transcription factor [Bellilinea sp.]